MNSELDPIQNRPMKTLEAVMASLDRRKKAERRFRLYGLFSIVLGLFFLVILLTSIVSNGYTAFFSSEMGLDIHFDRAVLDPEGKADPKALADADYDALWKQSLSALFPEVTERMRKRTLTSLVSSSASDRLRAMLKADPALLGTTQRVWLPLDDVADTLVKGQFDSDALEENEKLKNQKTWLEDLTQKGLVKKGFNRTFFSKGDSREPESAGIWGALVGSCLTLMVTLGLSLPLGMAAAVYLEEFAPKNRWTDLIEVNINNLAAVPSIVFGLLGLAVFINIFGIPRSSPLVGGLVLTLMTLPVIIIAGRSALKAVPPSVREAALGMGASPMQTVLDHVLPLATPGMLTGAIIGMARALGESAPLLMIGMVAFIVDIPGSITEPATVLPVQIYLWADSPERAFTEKTSAAILVLLIFLMMMNGLAVYLRKRFERRW